MSCETCRVSPGTAPCSRSSSWGHSGKGTTRLQGKGRKVRFVPLDSRRSGSIKGQSHVQSRTRTVSVRAAAPRSPPGGGAGTELRNARRGEDATRRAAGPAYLGAAVQGGLSEGAAAQDADGDVVQLLLLAGQAAAAAAGAAPARGLAAEVGADGVAVPLVLAQRHGGAAPRGPARPLPQRGPARPTGSMLAPAADPEPLPAARRPPRSRPRRPEPGAANRAWPRGGSGLPAGAAELGRASFPRAGGASPRSGPGRACSPRGVSAQRRARLGRETAPGWSSRSVSFEVETAGLLSRKAFEIGFDKRSLKHPNRVQKKVIISYQTYLIFSLKYTSRSAGFWKNNCSWENVMINCNCVPSFGSRPEDEVCCDGLTLHTTNNSQPFLCRS